ncbi:regulatory protein, luxR family [Ferrimonas sediminum]|uniref:Regulatory protein, luxR family n=1 Tax=Ferrimonas sediminum TaxID=718193 RepID=A0A1G8JWL3_9GAMM|nr:LuxR C-terminal-related transcriptional regulator [Ferrimonas sediminum]SDI35497.1 regulatory protein, luxR family [Ferrimonas sediminum]
MQPTGWIFYQSKCHDLSQHASCEMRSWDLKFDAEFECSNICVSRPALRQSACAVLASEKSVAFHFGLATDSQIQGQKVYSAQLNLGYLILLFDRVYRPKVDDVKHYFHEKVLPFLQPLRQQEEPTRRTMTIVKLTALGFTTTEIANALFLSNRGVDYHLDLAKKNLGATNKSALVFLAMQHGWLA